ncbi:CopG family transcriptional regulator [Arcanobacterium canis]|uniref:CopG family transcriptional regulator n=1 Tax=Arcanobacterium canis TaxID=999183 RepID=A0ABY8FYF6_9ACTO|nr:CopG family transcriptional regulator [Arcanobacterium canis]WFM83556.1 CopG family transcriptional regulator [Arcanobacterium canis]
MTTYHDVHGATFTDEDIERWAQEAESSEGYTGKHLGASVAGRPISVGVAARPFTIRLDVARRAKLNEIARSKETTPSQLIRDLIDAL